MNASEGWSDGQLNIEESGSAMINNISTNETLNTCAGRTLQLQIGVFYPPTLAMAARAINTVFYLLLMVFGVFLNVILIVLVLKFKELHTLSFVITLQVVIADLANAAAILPVQFITAAANQWLFGAHFCAIQGYLFLICSFSRTILMFVMVFDHFFAVFLTFLYQKHNKKMLGYLSVLSWLLVLSITLPGILDCLSFIPQRYFCAPNLSCSEACIKYGSFITYGILAPACIVPLLLYAALLRKAKKLKDSTPVPEDSTPKKEWRATITYLLLFVALFAVTLPFLIFSHAGATVNKSNHYGFPFCSIYYHCWL